MMKEMCIYLLLLGIFLSACSGGAELGHASEVNLDGTWDSYYVGSKLIISNYSKEEFDLNWDGNTTHYVRATKIPGSLRIEENREWYVAENGDYSGPYASVVTVGNNKYNLVVVSVGMSVHMITGANIDLNQTKNK